MLLSFSSWPLRWFTTICCLVLFSCNNAAPGNNDAEKILGSNNGGDFRGVNIGDNHSDVTSSEEGVSVYSMPDEVVYRVPLNKQDSTWYEISYNFNDNGLYNIDLEIFPKNNVASKTLKNDLITYYLNKYGDCTTVSGRCSWRAMTENGHYVSITLTDSFPDSHKPLIKVNFNESEK
jgi:hypothetical protein